MAGNHERNVGPMINAPRCGARTRKGSACAAPAIAGAARCRMHGGCGSGAPQDNTNARKHGAYDRDMRQRRAQMRLLKKRVRMLTELALAAARANTHSPDENKIICGPADKT